MMRKRWVLLVAAVLIAIAVAGGSLGRSEATQAGPSTQETSADTAPVERGNLTSTVSVYGTLGYRARPDGSPYAVINQTQGIYTKLPSVGDEVGCGDVLYRVDDHPVVLLCGSTPAYRSLSEGDTGPDVAELNANLMPKPISATLTHRGGFRGHGVKADGLFAEFVFNWRIKRECLVPRRSLSW